MSEEATSSITLHSQSPIPLAAPSTLSHRQDRQASNPFLVFHPAVKGPSELKLNIDISPSSTVLELKEAIAAKSDVEKERQRLIYSGTSARPIPTYSNPAHIQPGRRTSLHERWNLMA